MVDVGCRLADDLKKFSHKMEAVGCSIKQGVDVDGHLNLTLH